MSPVAYDTYVAHKRSHFVMFVCHVSAISLNIDVRHVIYVCSVDRTVQGFNVIASFEFHHLAELAAEEIVNVEKSTMLAGAL